MAMRRPLSCLDNIPNVPGPFLIHFSILLYRVVPTSKDSAPHISQSAGIEVASWAAVFDLLIHLPFTEPVMLLLHCVSSKLQTSEDFSLHFY